MKNEFFDLSEEQVSQVNGGCESPLCLIGVGIVIYVASQAIEGIVDGLTDGV